MELLGTTLRWAHVSLVALVLTFLGCAGDAADGAGPEPFDQIATFSQYLEAAAARTRLDSGGARVSRVMFDYTSDRWIVEYTVPGSMEAMPSFSQTASGSACSTKGSEGCQCGTTRCDEYTEAEEAKNAMEDDGWPVSDIYFDYDNNQWAFTWFEPEQPEP